MERQHPASAASFILFFIFAFTAALNPNLLTDDDISINCGSAESLAARSGREWRGDVFPKSTSSVGVIKGSSSRSSVEVANPELITSVDPVPYSTARISRSQFSYIFQASPGQKLIRLHFFPTSYKKFKSFKDLFTVEAGPFTLLGNFSASITADALNLNCFSKEFCVNIGENQPISITFSPVTADSQSKDTYAFINGIEIISVPDSLSYCHGGDIGVRVLGQKSVVYVTNDTALEVVRRLNVRKDSVSPVHEFLGMFGMWAAVTKERASKADNVTWRISVDVGFRYLVRLHFCELGLKVAEKGNSSFLVFVNHMAACTNADILQEVEDKGIVWHRNYMVMVQGRKHEGKRDILIDLHSENGFVDGHGPLEGFEIFKLSNHDNSLASPNPLPPTRNSPSQHVQSLFSFIGQRNAIAIVFISIICLVHIIAHNFPLNLGAKFTEEESQPSTRARRLCRHFSLAEIKSATRNFSDLFVIGKGGFGNVYMGIIDDGQETVAIKRLKSNSKQGKREFWTEIETLSELRHVNLVSLIGYCNEQQEMIIVYEYMTGGTLADHLYKLARKNDTCPSLSWKERLKICIGAGRGIDYLHTGHGVIHRDIKASNILLDENFVAKVSDFGLAIKESGSELQDQVSRSVKGTFGYWDPDYFRTRRLTMKSDTYSFGVVLLEVLCGRPAVDPRVEEASRSLTIWARDMISKGEVDQIIASSLRGEISQESLKAFVGIAERCLHEEPKKRPTIAHVVMNLEFALELQENPKSLAITKVADIFPFTDKTQQKIPENFVPNEITGVSHILPCMDKTQQQNTKFLSPSERISVVDVLPYTDRSMLSMKMGSSNLLNVTSTLNEQTNRKLVDGEPSLGRRDGRKSTIHKLSQIWPWDAFRNRGKQSKKKNIWSISAPMARRKSKVTKSEKGTDSRILYHQAVRGSDELNSIPNLRIFSFSELKAATRNFGRDMVLGEGGFGPVFKGLIDDKSTTNKSGSFIAVKMLNCESMQGFKEWQAEVNFLGRLSHPNLVKLFGYCSEDDKLLLVYEFMPKGSLDNHLYGRSFQPVPWDIRLQILIDAAHGLAFLHDRGVICRDFKPSNILLDESYRAKLSDFGLAKSGPSADQSHVSTRVMGTWGYAAPEYIATGHLTFKSDVYSFGIILLEMLTGLRALDKSRPHEKQNLISWAGPNLSKMSKLQKIMDPRLEGRYPTRSASGIAQIALRCLETEPKKRPTMQEIVEALERMEDPAAAVEKRGQTSRVHFS